MSQQNAQALKTNMFSIFLPTFLAIMFAVPMAAVLSFVVLRADRSSAEAVQTANTGVQYMCVDPKMSPAPHTDSDSEGAAPSGSMGSAPVAFGPMMPALSTGSITQNSTTITTTSYDYSVSGSYNNTQSWVDSHNRTITSTRSNTQSWSDSSTTVNDNSNQGNPVTTTTTTSTIVTDNSVTGSNNPTNTQSWSDSHDNTQSFTDSHDNTQSQVNDNSVTGSNNPTSVVAPVTTTTVTDDHSIQDNDTTTTNTSLLSGNVVAL
jgi:hypothetical protein